MNACNERERLQDLLDGLLPETEAGDVRRHAAGCRACGAELAAFERVMGVLDRLPLANPRPELMDLVLARVLPSRRRHHRIAAVGLGYAACLAAFSGLVVLASGNPAARTTAELGLALASRGFLHVAGFLTQVAGTAVLWIAGGLKAAAAIESWVAPVGRAMQAVLTSPSLVAALLSAFAVCGALLWWLRPVAVRRRGTGPAHLGILGFWGMA